MVEDLVSNFRPTSNFHQASYTYALLMWAWFLIYCGYYQAGRIYTYVSRRKALKTGLPQPYRPGFLARALHKLEYTVHLPVQGDYMAVKHLLILSIIIVINALFILFAPFTYTSDGVVIPAVGQMDRRAAYVACANFSFVIVLGSRNTLLTKMSGLSFEQLIPFHRWLAKLGFAEMITHIVWRIMVAAQRYGTAQAALFVDIEQGTGTIATLGYLILYVTSLGYIRRNYFEVFYYSHIVGIVVSIAASMWHEVGIMFYFTPALFLYFVDRFMRSYNSWFQETKLVQLEAAGNTITRVVFEKAQARSTYRPGQYVFVAFSGSVNGFGSLKKWFKWANWHPMTISETYHYNHTDDQPILEKQLSTEMLEDEKKKEGSITSSSSSTAVHCELNEIGQRHVPRTENEKALLGSLHIKTLGNYTERLCELASTRSEQIKLRVDGPFGAPLDLADQQVFVAVSTGVGITPSLAFVKDLVDRRSLGLATVETHTIHFVWSVTNEDCSRKAKSAFLPLSFNVEIYITRENEPGCFDLLQKLSKDYQWTLDYKRLNAQDIALRISDLHPHACLHTCGSSEFTAAVKNAGVERGWSVHDEIFEF
ncbi:hypothetical protein INT43_006759 [Umbelopsis isabellina]|uniref:Ferric oxidoreductase domain-containing protein n=1 Tax=Mortierella isabellina TaxID=91625 RepID=A0A8H7Q1Q7_MORIS|nr:hypothetical protein INT43_006759 [Umbelopsis isabellina]